MNKHRRVQQGLIKSNEHKQWIIMLITSNKMAKK